MLNLGFGEFALIMVLAIVVVGPDRLPEMVRFLGRQYGKLRRASDELRQAFVLEAEKAEAERRSELLKQRREEARARAEQARARVRASRNMEPTPGDPPPSNPLTDPADSSTEHSAHSSTATTAQAVDTTPLEDKEPTAQSASVADEVSHE